MNNVWVTDPAFLRVVFGARTMVHLTVQEYMEIVQRSRWRAKGRNGVDAHVRYEHSSDCEHGIIGHLSGSCICTSCAEMSKVTQIKLIHLVGHTPGY